MTWRKFHFKNQMKSILIFKFKSEDFDWYTAKPKIELKSIFAKKDNIVFWDSRIPHQAQRDLKTMILIIATFFMLPRLCVKENKITARIKSFKEENATSYWPNKAKLFAKNPPGC